MQNSSSRALKLGSSQPLLGAAILLVTLASFIGASFFISPSQVKAAVNTLFSDGFENNPAFTSPSWTADSQWATTGSSAHSGSKKAKVQGNSDVGGAEVLETTINTSGYESLTLAFWYRYDGLEADDSVKVEWYNGSIWQELTSFVGAAGTGDDISSWTQWTGILPSGAENNASFGIRFVSDMNAGDDVFYLDDVSVTGSQIVQIPACSGTDIPGFTTFETLSLGSVNGQNGWSSTGPYDQEVVPNIYGYTSFGCKSLRLSNAVTTGAFGDQTFASPASSAAGESSVASNNRYEAQFDIAATQSAYQPGLFISVSPDDGNGSRMGYLGFSDQSDGIHVNFYDVANAGPLGTGSSFVQAADIAVLSRTVPHTIKFVIDFVDGPGNDEVQIYIDNVLVHTGTTWEDYYRYDPEQNGNGNQLFPIDTLLFRAGGSSAPSTDGLGYLFDNISVETSLVSTDNTPPEIMVKDGYDGDLETKTFCEVSFKLHDDVAVDYFVINGHTFELTDNEWSDANFDAIGQYLVVGNNVLEVFDTSGNSSTYEFTGGSCLGPQQCSVTVVSDETNYVSEKPGFAVALSFIHSAWTAVIEGATWIWGDNPVATPTQNETQTFIKTFEWSGPIDSAILHIAADNYYTVSINGVQVGSEQANENNFQIGTQDQYNVADKIVPGSNTIEVVVTNKGVNGSTPTSNPAGLKYNLTIVSTETGNDCTQAPPPELLCPLVPSEDGILIDLGTNQFLLANSNEAAATLGPVAVNIPAGYYDVTLASYDDHTGHGGQGQEHEEWYAVFKDVLDALILTNPISDIPENEDWKIEQVNTVLYFENDVTSLTALHNAYSSNNPESVYPSCVLLEPVDEPNQCVDELDGGWADTVESADQGLTKGGSAVSAGRSNPDIVLGTPDWTEGSGSGFYSLGFGGSIVVAFDSFVPNVAGNDISIHEATNGVYPSETALIEVSQTGDDEDWYEVGVAGNAGDGVSYFDFDSTGLAWIKYVRVTDTTNPALHINSADAFDLVAVDATQTVCSEPEPTPKFADVTLCKYSASEQPLSGWTLMLLGDEVDSFAVNASNLSGTNSVELALGGSYVAKASGVWLNDRNPDNHVDPEYSTEDGWTTTMDGFTGYGVGILELEINETDGYWGPYNSLHEYAQQFTALANGPANFRIFDGDTGTHTVNPGWYGDNSGSLDVVLYEGYAGVTNENGCVVFEGVPYGEYSAEELAQEGWEQVDGPINPVVIDSPTESFTFVNAVVEEPLDAATLTIVKYADGLIGDFEWLVSTVEDFSENLYATTNSDGYATTTLTLGTGSATYTVAEVNLGDWSFEGASCTFANGDPVTGSSITNGYQFDAVDGDDIICHFYNETYCGEDEWYSEETKQCEPTKGYAYSDLSISKSVETDGSPIVGEAATYTISVTNNGPAMAQNIIVTDNLPSSVSWVSHTTSNVGLNDSAYDPNTGVWTILALGDGATVTLEILVEIGQEGLISNTATVEITDLNGIDPSSSNNSDVAEFTAGAAPSNPGPETTTQSFLGGGPLSFGPPAPQVLGAFTTGEVLGESCGLYMNQHLRRGYSRNDVEQVAKLQEFLNKHGYGTLEVNGEFDEATEIAVKAFQQAYASEILVPWNIGEPTGLVYLTTLRMINLIECPHLSIQIPSLVVWGGNSNSSGNTQVANREDSDNQEGSTNDDGNNDSSSDNSGQTASAGNAVKNKGFWQRLWSTFFGN